MKKWVKSILSDLLAVVLVLTSLNLTGVIPVYADDGGKAVYELIPSEYQNIAGFTNEGYDAEMDPYYYSDWSSEIHTNFGENTVTLAEFIDTYGSIEAAIDVIGLSDATSAYINEVRIVLHDEASETWPTYSGEVSQAIAPGFNTCSVSLDDFSLPDGEDMLSLPVSDVCLSFKTTGQDISFSVTQPFFSTSVDPSDGDSQFGWDLNYGDEKDIYCFTNYPDVVFKTLTGWNENEYEVFDAVSYEYVSEAGYYKITLHELDDATYSDFRLVAEYKGKELGRKSLAYMPSSMLCISAEMQWNESYNDVLTVKGSFDSNNAGWAGKTNMLALRFVSDGNSVPVSWDEIEVTSENGGSLNASLFKTLDYNYDSENLEAVVSVNIYEITATQIDTYTLSYTNGEKTYKAYVTTYPNNVGFYGADDTNFEYYLEDGDNFFLAGDGETTTIYAKTANRWKFSGIQYDTETGITHTAVSDELITISVPNSEELDGVEIIIEAVSDNGEWTESRRLFVSYRWYEKDSLAITTELDFSTGEGIENPRISKYMELNETKELTLIFYSFDEQLNLGEPLKVLTDGGYGNSFIDGFTMSYKEDEDSSEIPFENLNVSFNPHGEVSGMDVLVMTGTSYEDPENPTKIPNATDFVFYKNGIYTFKYKDHTVSVKIEESPYGLINSKGEHFGYDAKFHFEEPETFTFVPYPEMLDGDGKYSIFVLGNALGYGADGNKEHYFTKIKVNGEYINFSNDAECTDPEVPQARYVSVAEISGTYFDNNSGEELLKLGNQEDSEDPSSSYVFFPEQYEFSVDDQVEFEIQPFAHRDFIVCLRYKNGDGFGKIKQLYFAEYDNTEGERGDNPFGWDMPRSGFVGIVISKEEYENDDIDWWAPGERATVYGSSIKEVIEKITEGIKRGTVVNKGYINISVSYDSDNPEYIANSKAEQYVTSDISVDADIKGIIFNASVNAYSCTITFPEGSVEPELIYKQDGTQLMDGDEPVRADRAYINDVPQAQKAIEVFVAENADNREDKLYFTYATYLDRDNYFYVLSGDMEHGFTLEDMTIYYCEMWKNLGESAAPGQNAIKYNGKYYINPGYTEVLINLPKLHVDATTEIKISGRFEDVPANEANLFVNMAPNSVSMINGERYVCDADGTVKVETVGSGVPSKTLEENEINTVSGSFHHWSLGQIDYHYSVEIGKLEVATNTENLDEDALVNGVETSLDPDSMFEQLMGDVLDSSEKALVEGGKNITVELKVGSIEEDDAAASIKEVVDDDGFETVQYLNIDLNCYVGFDESSAKSITETGDDTPVTISFAVPGGTSTDVNDYQILRDHDGVADTLTPTSVEVNPEGGVIVTFETSKFCDFALVLLSEIDIESAEVTLGDELVYTGSAQTQEVASVKVGKKILTEGTDYDVTGNTNTDAGTYTLTITGKDNYTGTVTKEYTIAKADQTELTFDAITATYGDGEITLNAAGGESSEAIIYSLESESDYASITGDKLTVLGATDELTVIATRPGNANYNEVSASQTIKINKKQLTPVLTGSVSKVYDGTKTVTDAESLDITLDGMLVGDGLTVSSVAYEYASSNAGTGIDVKATGITFEGDKKDNYVLSATEAVAAVGEITKAEAEVTLGNLNQVSNAISAVTVTLNPASADATVTVEYKVIKTPAKEAVEGKPCKYAGAHLEGCEYDTETSTCTCGFDSHSAHDADCGYVEAAEAEEAVYEWVTIVPREAGEYEVRAYISDGGLNLESKAVADAVSGTLKITKYVAPAPTPTPEPTPTPAPEEQPKEETPTEVKTPSETPVRPTQPNVTPVEQTPTEAEPAEENKETETSEEKNEVTSQDGNSNSDIEVVVETKLSENTKEAWADLAETVLEAVVDKDGNAVKAEVKVEMGEVTEVSGEFFETIKGKDVDVVFEMEGGISWTINGADIGNVNFDEINLEVKLDKGAIPADKIDELSSGNEVINLSLTHDGEFGFKAILTIDAGAKNAGMYANLYYYDEANGKYEFICAAMIDEAGNAALGFEHASDYTIVIDKVAATVSNNAAVNSQTSVVAANAQTSGINWAMLLIVLGVLLLVIIAAAVIRAKMTTRE